MLTIKDLSLLKCAKKSLSCVLRRAATKEPIFFECNAENCALGLRNPNFALEKLRAAKCGLEWDAMESEHD